MTTSRIPAVTVLMPVYNAAAYLREAIDSILHQTFRDFEFLVIDDGSTDQSRSIIESYQDPRIRLIYHQRNQGLVSTLNEGITETRSPLVARSDADDVSAPSRLAEQVEFLNRHPGVALVGSDLEIMGPDGQTVGYTPAFIRDQTIRRALAVTNTFAHGSVMFRSDRVRQVGGFRPEAYLTEDYDLWTRLSRVGKLANVPRPLYRWRVNPVGESFSKARIQRRAESSIADRTWERFGPQGPAPLGEWCHIWQQEDLSTPPARRRRRQMAQLHVAFARAYFRREQRALGLRHALAAVEMDRSCMPFYFYLLPGVLPATIFSPIEKRLRTAYKELRGW